MTIINCAQGSYGLGILPGVLPYIHTAKIPETYEYWLCHILKTSFTFIPYLKMSRKWEKGTGRQPKFALYVKTVIKEVNTVLKYCIGIF